MNLPEGRSAGAVAPCSRAAALGQVAAAQSPHPWHGCRIHPSSSQLTPKGIACLEQGSRSHSRKEKPKSAALSPPAARPQHHEPAAPREPQLTVPPARTPQPWGHRRAPGCFTAPRAAESPKVPIAGWAAAVSTSTVLAASRPRAQLCSAREGPGNLPQPPALHPPPRPALASLCRVPFPDCKVEHVLTRPSPAPLPAAPRAVPAQTRNYRFCLWAITDLIAALPGEGRPGRQFGSAPRGV